jgi:hypothetical protein
VFAEKFAFAAASFNADGRKRAHVKEKNDGRRWVIEIYSILIDSFQTQRTLIQGGPTEIIVFLSQKEKANPPPQFIYK